MLGMPPREALNEGMRRCRLEAPLPPPRESLSAGKRRPQQASRETPRAGVLALQKSVSAVLKGSTPGYFEESPPWNIEWEPGGGKSSILKRPFEASNKGDTAGYIGPHKNESGHSKIALVQAAPQISKHHVPLDLSSQAAVEIVKHFGLEPEQEGDVQVVLWQKKTLHTQPPCDESRHCHTHSCIWHRVMRWPHSKS